MPEEGTEQTFTRTLKLPDGKEQTYEAASEQELLDKIFNAHQSSVTALKDRERQIHDNKAEIERARAEMTRLQMLQKPDVQSDGGFKTDDYYQMWADQNRGPDAATDYMLKAKYGISLKELASSAKELKELKETLSAQTAVQGFHARHQDFPATDEASTMIRDRVNQLVSNGFPVHADTIDLAYTQLIREGSITPTTPETTEEEQSRGAGAPPVTTRTVPDATPEIDWDSLSTEDMEKKLREVGML